MPILGRDTIGASGLNTETNVRGIRQLVVPDDGSIVLESMSAYIYEDFADNTHTVSCGVWDAGDGRLLAQTNVRQDITQTPSWVTFTFLGAPIKLEPGIAINIGILSSGGGGNLLIRYNSGGEPSFNDANPLDGTLPNPLVPSFNTSYPSIYLTYEVAKVKPPFGWSEPRTTQPPAGTLVDKSHPLAPTFMFVGGQKSTLGYDAVSGKKQDGGGGAYHYDGVEPTGQYGGAFFNNMALRIEEKGSFTWYVRGLGAWGTFDYFADFSAAAGGVDIHIRTGDPVDDVFIEHEGGNSTYDLTGIDDGYPHVLTWVYEASGSAADQHLYIDGILFGTLNQSKTASSGVDTDITIGHEQSGGFSQLANTAINAVMYHPRRLTASEVAALHGNIWQIFEPQEIFFPEPPKRKLVVM